MPDLFDSRWEIPDLHAADFAPYNPPVPTDEEKDRLWKAYNNRQAADRVPMGLGINNRVALLDRRNDPGGLTYEQMFSSPEAMLRGQLLYEYISRRWYHRFCDYPRELPEAWHVSVHLQNVYEAWFFGCPVNFHSHQIPDTAPIYTDGRKDAIFDIDITRPLERAPFSTVCEFTDFLTDYVKDKTFRDRPIVVDPPAYVGTDGPLTVAMNVRGPDILLDMMDDADYAHRLFRFIVDAALHRRRAFASRYHLSGTAWGMADDSIAMIGTDQYREMMLPHHRYWYESIGSVPGKRGVHLCGDATRHFPTLHQELGVTSFDTGFPVDFAWLRKTLGPEVEILGGVEVGLLVSAAAAQVYERSKQILTSGIKAGGRFVFREGNNLPPNVPWSNLAAMYQAVQDFGKL